MFWRHAAIEFWKNTAVELDAQRRQPCKVCDILKEELAFARTQLERERQDRKEERDEFKRTVDLLLRSKGLEAVGQGPTPSLPKEATPKDLNDLFSLEVEGGKVRMLRESEMM